MIEWMVVLLGFGIGYGLLTLARIWYDSQPLK